MMKLKDVFSESFDEVFNRLKDKIANESISRDDYSSVADGVSQQLVENWCLCKYCQMFDSENQNYRHWMTEFRSYAIKLKRLNLKSGSKKKLLTKLYVDDFDFDDTKTIFVMISDKFEVEGFDDLDARMIVADEFSSSINELIGCISDERLQLVDYISNEFGI